ncbi:hypothetical protein [Candidatus Magnetaquicoccus inordinatus]|uniref:hypothetical protein n=1 Tax=Candidatus Magnetaquicoccus inordinatus TaxID=2496818 RepID=UPI00102CC765|nr:hypothetical protein [Candidatus Magnetaquicoccus inordinatus]
MAIQASEIKWYKSLVVNDGASNGGVLSADECIDGVKNNVWPDVSQAERLAGSVKYRKTFIKIANADNLALLDPCIFIESATPGDDSIVLLAGTQTDTQNEAVAYNRFYGAARLDVDATVGDQVLLVNVESGNGLGGHEIFRNGDLIRVADKGSVDAVGGNAEFVRLASSNAVSWNGTQATLHLAAGVSLSNSYGAANTKVASVLETDDIEAMVSGWSESTVSGSFDEVNTPLLLDHIGTVEQQWTLTFTSSTQFNCHGHTLGLVGSGALGGAAFAPLNADFNRPYFTLATTTPPWGGTWQAGESIQFTTHPAAVAVWEKRTVPAGANSFSGNKVIVAITGESE